MPRRYYSRLRGKFGRRLAGDLPEGVGKRRHAGIAEIGRQLLDRNIDVGREVFDRRRDPGALAPAFEAQLRLGREQPRQRPRRGADLARQRVDLIGAGRVRERGSWGSGMKVAEASAWCNSSMASLIRRAVRSGVLWSSNSARIAWWSSG